MKLLRFNMLLAEAGIAPADVCLIRHQKKLAGSPTPYALWVRDHPAFEVYQSTQAPRNRKIFSLPIWAGFVATPTDETLFTGLYSARLAGTVSPDLVDPISGRRPYDDLTPADWYECAQIPDLAPYAGRLKIDWGDGARAWRQYAVRHDKPIVELTQAFREEAFPGFTRFIASFSDLPSLPVSWIGHLRQAKGIYLLTCPRNHEQYIGAAPGADGFWGRWQAYIATGHGGNEGLKSRDPADYRISILEVAGSAATVDAISEMEVLWKRKLQSREMGLNRN